MVIAFENRFIPSPDAKLCTVLYSLQGDNVARRDVLRQSTSLQAQEFITKLRVYEGNGVIPCKEHLKGVQI